MLKSIPLVLLVWGFCVSEAAANEKNILGLLKFPESNPADARTAPSALSQIAGDHDCTIRHAGPLLSSRGGLISRRFDMFFVLICSDDKTMPNRKDVLGRVTAADLVLLKGTSTAPAAVSATFDSDRLFVIKLGRYKDKKSKTRDADLRSINEAVAQVPTRYVDDLFFLVDQSEGIVGVDEVTVLYYPSDQAAKQFRDENPDILKRIGKFNANHLRSFTYLNARSQALPK